MARGKYKTQRGGGRHFSARPRVGEDPDSSVWALNKGSDASSGEEESGSEDERPTAAVPKPKAAKDTNESDSDSEDDSPSSLIEVSNPNRAPKKVGLKASELSEEPPRELSRREREELEKRKAQKKYWDLHAQGKTEQARSDLERLRIIRAEREEAAKQRAAEAEAKAEAARAKMAARNLTSGSRRK